MYTSRPFAYSLFTDEFQVPPELAPVFGVVAASAIILVESFTIFIKETFDVLWVDVLLMQYDVLHIGIVHAGSGLVGMFLTAFLNRPEIFVLDGFSTAEGYSHDVAQLRLVYLHSNTMF